MTCIYYNEELTRKLIQINSDVIENEEKLVKKCYNYKIIINYKWEKDGEHLAQA